MPRPLLMVEDADAVEIARSIAGTVYDVVHRREDYSSTLIDRQCVLWPNPTPESREAFEAIAAVAAIVSQSVHTLPVEDSGGPASANGWTYDTWKTWVESRTTITLAAPAMVVANGITQVNVTTDDAPVTTTAAVLLWENIGLALTSTGQPVCNTDNVLRVLERYAPFHEMLWFDEFSQRLLTTWHTTTPREWRDADTVRLLVVLQRTLGLARIKQDDVARALLDYGKQHARYAPRDWVASLAWDQHPRIATCLIEGFGAPDSAYTRAASENFWIGLAARIAQPGCKFDNMLILEGSQGRFKSRALETLGGAWYAEATESIMHKDFYLCLQGKLIVEVADLSSFARAEVNTLKKVITCRIDRYRTPYGHLPQDYPRVGVLVGTTNEASYLRDPTGGRRFWPVACGKINLSWLSSSRDQLFAEAMARYQAGALWYEMPEEETAEAQEERRHSDSWEEPIADYLLSKESVTLTEVLTECLHFDLAKIGRVDELRVASILHAFHWKSTVIWKAGRSLRRWTPLDRTPGEEG